MKRFIGFIRKEFYHIFRDYRTMLILFGMPFAQVLLFGFVITNEIKNIRIAIYDQAHDDVTRHLTNKLLSSGYFILEKNISDDSEIEQSFKEGKIKEVIVFEPNFGAKLERDKTASMQIIADATDANTANLIVNYTTGIVRNYLAQQNANLQMPMQIVPQIRMMYNEELKGVYMFVPGIMAMILMLVSALMTSISITREKEMGTMEVLLVSPLRPLQIVLGKVAPYLALSFINSVIILILAFLVFNVPVQGNIILLLAETLLYIFLSLSLGIFISTVAKSQQVAMMLSAFALMLPTILLSGFIFPIENMPVILQRISDIVPARWYISAVKTIMIQGLGISYVLKEVAVLTFMGIVLVTVSLKKFKVRLE